MIPLHALQGQKFLIVGLGKSGMSALHALNAAHISVLAWDDKPETRAQAGALALDHINAIDWNQLTAVIWSPGIAHTLPTAHPIAEAARAHNVPLICDVDLLCRAKPDAQIIGITGTNGKSTTTSLIAHIISKSGRPYAVGGNLGHPVLELEDLGDDGFYVLELSSYQLELVPSLRCKVAVHLNISPDHIDRHGDLNGYVAAKMHLFASAKSNSVAIIGVDDPKSEGMAQDVIKYGQWDFLPISTTKSVQGGVYVQGTHLIDHTDETPELILDLQEVPALTGSHNAQNTAAAYAAVRTIGLSIVETVAGIRTFPGLAHRQERVCEHNNVVYINDSKATNAEATECALLAYTNIFWIAGGMAKAGGITALAPYFGKIKKAYLIGDAAEAFAKTLPTTTPYILSHTLEAALIQAHADAQACAKENPHSKPIVMLSPACASWDQYKSFEARGDEFRKLALALTSDNHGGRA